MLPHFPSLVKEPGFEHISGMLDVSRERESPPECTLTPREVRAVASKIELCPTPSNLLALMLAIGTGRFVRIEYGSAR